MYFSGSAFLVSFTDLNKQSLNVKSVFKSLCHWLSIYICIYTYTNIYYIYILCIYIYYIYLYIYIYIGIEILLSIKQCPWKYTSGNI